MVYEKSVVRTVRKVQGRYEKSMVRIVHGTKSLAFRARCTLVININFSRISQCNPKYFPTAVNHDRRVWTSEYTRRTRGSIDYRP